MAVCVVNLVFTDKELHQNSKPEQLKDLLYARFIQKYDLSTIVVEKPKQQANQFDR